MTEQNPFGKFEPKDLEDLQTAPALLEYPGFFIRMTNWLGSPVEAGLKKLPQGAQEAIQDVTRMALTKTLDLAVTSLDPGTREDSWNWMHKLAVTAPGAAGGFFGLAGLLSGC